MLQKLSIQNYALIKSLDIEPNQGLNTITGETGAGKSIMLGALGLLLGKRADSSVVFDTEKKCIIEGTFNIAAYQLETIFDEFDIDFEEESIIRREVNSNGKSRAFVNDTPTTLDFLKKLGVKLMDVHSQHETIQLGNESYQLEIIDAVSQSHHLLNEFRNAYSTFSKKNLVYENLLKRSAELKKEADYHQFLFDELDQAQFSEGEQEELETELSTLEHAEEIKLKLNEALEVSDRSEFNASTLLNEVKNSLQQIANYSPSFEQLKQRIESVQIELKDVINELETEEMKVDINPERTVEVQDRLSLLYKLQQKHQVSDIEGLLKIYHELTDKVMEVSNMDDTIIEAEKEKEKSYQEALHKAKKLSSNRKKVFSKFSDEIAILCSTLGMPNATIEVKHEESALNRHGIDQIEILFSANKGVAPAPLKTAASGGEFSRLMFAIKYILAGKTALPTMVFDEIDTGISGEIALKMGEMMNKMAAKHQVITITHLPQIAAKGEAHYFVYKDDSDTTTTSNIRKLDQNERLNELAQMIGGANYSESALTSAKELIK